MNILLNQVVEVVADQGWHIRITHSQSGCAKYEQKSSIL